MGVIYHAHARFLDARQGKITVPAPVDPATPQAPWWYDLIADRAQAWAQAGFTAILYPPVSKTQSGHYPTGDGYGVFDNYDIGWKNQAGSRQTRFGDREQLQRSIAVARACGLDVYIDVVMHQLVGSNGGDGVYTYLGAEGVAGTGRFAKHPGCFRGAPPRRPADIVPSPADDFSFGDEFVFLNSLPPRYTIDGMRGYGDWLTRSLGIQGFRIDDVKGTSVAFLREWMQAPPMGGRFCVAEYFDGNPAALGWWAHGEMNGRASVYDFTLHWALQAMCAGGDMRRMDGAGYTAADPFGAVTFVDNPDTDLSQGQQIIGSKLLAYAFILTTEGYPTVYHKDYAQDAGCYGLQPWIDNLVWIHEHLANGTTVTRLVDSRVIVLERQGFPGLLTALSNDGWNARPVTCQTSFGPNTRLHDYTGRRDDIWTDAQGRARFTIPSNAFGDGQSYLCFSRTGRDGGGVLHGMAAEQVVFGAADLDIGPVRGGHPVSPPRIYAKRGSPLRAALVIDRSGWTAASKVDLTITGPDLRPLPAHAWTITGSAPFVTTIAATGWQSLHLTSNLPRPLNFQLALTYTAPQKP